LTTIATICARGGSAGVPGKNIRMLAGRPLIAHTIAQAIACEQVDEVYVSTDSEAIAEVARKAGAHVPYLRPAELATSTAAKVPVIQHLLAQIEKEGVTVSRIVDLDPTSPLRITEDIVNCLALYDDDTDIVITAFESEKSPYFNMVERRPDGKVGLVKPPATEIFGRQGAPKVYSMNASIYVWRPLALSRGIWDNRIKMYEMPRERSIDIDSELDFLFVERLMELRYND
jgi:CMP-N,N'-diacetyllegionaminic acid synthase